MLSPGSTANPFLMLLLYVGPDQILPVTSLLGMIGGLLMLFWTHVRAFFQRVGRAFTRKSPPKPEREGS